MLFALHFKVVSSILTIFSRSEGKKKIVTIVYSFTVNGLRLTYSHHKHCTFSHMQPPWEGTTQIKHCTFSHMQPPWEGTTQIKHCTFSHMQPPWEGTTQIKHCTFSHMQPPWEGTTQIKHCTFSHMQPPWEGTTQIKHCTFSHMQPPWEGTTQIKTLSPPSCHWGSRSSASGARPLASSAASGAGGTSLPETHWEESTRPWWPFRPARILPAVPIATTAPDRSAEVLTTSSRGSQLCPEVAGSPLTWCWRFLPPWSLCVPHLSWSVPEIEGHCRNKFSWQPWKRWRFCFFLLDSMYTFDPPTHMLHMHTHTWTQTHTPPPTPHTHIHEHTHTPIHTRTHPHPHTYMDTPRHPHAQTHPHTHT